jgi:hypothetical protein
MATALFHQFPQSSWLRSRGPHGYSLVPFLPAALMARALFRLFPRSAFLQYHGQSVLMATALFRLLALLFFSSLLLFFSPLYPKAIRIQCPYLHIYYSSARKELLLEKSDC